MHLKEYMIKNNLNNEDIAKRIDAGKTYVRAIAGAMVKPGKALMKVIEMATDGEVTRKDMMEFFQDISNKKNNGYCRHCLQKLPHKQLTD